MRHATDSVILQDVAARPHAFDFFHVMRRLEAARPDLPRLGEAARPADEPVRLGQEPRLDFAPAAISGVRPASGARPPVIEVRFLGLLGPNGPLPLHLTDYARDRMLHRGDATFARFLDLINHRFILLFYRAWAQAQPVTSLDRARDDRFATYVGALFGAGLDSTRDHDAAEDEIKLRHAGTLARAQRNADGLQALLADYLRLPVRVEEFVARWLPLADGDRTQLGGAPESARLGSGAVLGASVWDAQSNVRVHVTAPTLQDYEQFLPGGPLAARLVALVHSYLGWEFGWDLRLSLARADVTPACLGKSGRLGWTSWLQGGERTGDAHDLLLDYTGTDTKARKQ